MHVFPYIAMAACYLVHCNDCMFLSAFDGYTDFPRSVLVGHASLGSDCTFSVFCPLAPVALFFFPAFDNGFIFLF